MRDDIFALLHLIEKNMQSTHNYSAKGDFCTVGDLAVIFSPTCRCSKNTVMFYFTFTFHYYRIFRGCSNCFCAGCFWTWKCRRFFVTKTNCAFISAYSLKNNPPENHCICISVCLPVCLLLAEEAATETDPVPVTSESWQCHCLAVGNRTSNPDSISTLVFVGFFWNVTKEAEKVWHENSQGKMLTMKRVLFCSVVLLKYRNRPQRINVVDLNRCQWLF